MLDISDSRKVEAALRDRNEALEEADRLKTAFVSNMSYELRTPLTSIAGFAEMLAEGYAGPLPDMAVEYVKAVLESVARLGALIDNVLDLTQSDTGSLLLAEDEIDLAALSNEAAAAAADAAGRGEVELVSQVEPSVGIITGDSRRLGQAIGNAEERDRLHPAGGRVRAARRGRPRQARIIVSDNGHGIAHADQARAHRFSRTIEGRSGDEAAIGLAHARQVFVEAHGGTIELNRRRARAPPSPSACRAPPNSATITRLRRSLNNR